MSGCPTPSTPTMRPPCASPASRTTWRTTGSAAGNVRQAGETLILDELGIARRGMIVRHLVLPERLSGTPQVLCWIAAELSPRLHVSLMDPVLPRLHGSR